MAMDYLFASVVILLTLTLVVLIGYLALRILWEFTWLVRDKRKEIERR